ncbi:Transcription termination factor 2 [Papilio xuthus]|uniref:Transcription termination factor 2 n=1 Tax=Papilio xuthus TaxID=66420 RepID=A0A194PH95_PAPXU|nr:Transcription termination factor 2 [Papilio xuthus]
MESSFFEYRDSTKVEGDSETEVIDDSFVGDQSFITKKKLGFKNQTVFISESEESASEDASDEDDNAKKSSSTSTNNISDAAPTLISSSEDETRRESPMSSSGTSRKSDDSSSDEEMSPEIVPRPRPNTKTPRRSSDSFIGRKNRKRIMIVDSDTDNSIVIEQNKNKKLACLQQTPLKVKSNVLANAITDNCDNIDVSHLNDTNEKDIESSDEEKDCQKVHNDKSTDEVNDKEETNDEDDGIDKEITKDSDNSMGEDKSGEVESDEYDDHMVMSRATRMSIMGFVPKETASDESDYIQSDDNSSRPGSSNSLGELPDFSASLRMSPEKANDAREDKDTSRLTCSPFTSPLKDVTNEFNESFKDKSNGKSKVENEICDLTHKEVEVYDLTGSKRASLRNKVLSSIRRDNSGYKENVINDDVTIIDREPEVIALSSDDEEPVKEEKKSPRVKKSPSKRSEKSESKSEKVSGDMRQYLLPPSYPNQVVYVKKHVRENELKKLTGLQEDLHNVRNLLENMDVGTLPDGGVRLIERLTALEQAVRLQGDKVANMLVEPDAPTAEDIAKDGFDSEDKGLSWDDIKKASEAVQPRMFGKQAMSTHMAERGLILERLRDLHQALASRPPEHQLADPPAALATTLMPHQLHALTWLRWRETQRPAGGILADDMGLGKTITMISLVAGDKEADDDGDDDSDDAGPGAKQLVRGGTLVVCPASLVQQWAEEAARHCRPHRLGVCMHHGAARATQPHRLAHHDLVITTYNILLREAEKVRSPHTHVPTSRTPVYPLPATPSHCTWPRVPQMWKKWIDNKSLGGQERLSTIMRCIMLRRTKQQLQARGQLACLPARDTHDLDVTLSRDEMNVYQKLLVLSKTLFAQFLQQRAEQRHDQLGDRGAYHAMHRRMVKLQGVKPVKSHEILVLLLRLRQVCCHCGLIAAMLRDDDSAHPTDPADPASDPAEQDLLDELNKLVLEDTTTKRKSKGGAAGGEDAEEGEGEGEEGSTTAEALRSVLAANNPVFALDRPSSKIAAVMACLNEHVFPNEGKLARAEVEVRWGDVS